MSTQSVDVTDTVDEVQTVDSDGGPISAQTTTQGQSNSVANGGGLGVILKNPCMQTLLNAINNQFGTSFGKGNVTGGNTFNAAFNIVVRGVNLPPGAFNSLQPGRYPIGVGGVLGSGASLHIEGSGPSQDFPPLSNGNVGGVTSVGFTAHTDTGWPYNPVGGIRHAQIDVRSKGANRSPCPT